MAAKKMKIGVDLNDGEDIEAQTADRLSTMEDPKEAPEEPRDVKFIVNMTQSTYQGVMGACTDLGISASGKIHELVEAWLKTPEAMEARASYEAYKGPYQPKSKKRKA